MAPVLNRSVSLRHYLWPRRLVGQMGLVIALALTAAQVMNVFMLLNWQQLNQLARRNGLAESFCGEAIADLFSASPEQAAAQVSGMSNNPWNWWRPACAACRTWNAMSCLNRGLQEIWRVEAFTLPPLKLARVLFCIG